MATMTRAQRAAKRLRDRNYRFRKMPRNRQRVAIARDVLELLDKEKLLASRGTYLLADTNLNLDRLDPEITLRDFISKPQVTCEVCAIGAVFSAAVLSRGVDGHDLALTTDDYIEDADTEFREPDRSYMLEELAPYFHEDELLTLERYFEDWSRSTTEDDEEALREAMNLLIATNGASLVPRTERQTQWERGYR